MRLIVPLLLLQLLFSVNTIAQNVYIQGKWENGPASVALNYFEDVTTAKSGTLRSVIDPESHSFEFHIEVDHATILRLANELFLVLPGDTVNVKIIDISGEPKLTFEGRKQNEHSFLSRLKEEIGWFQVSEYLIDKNSVGEYKMKATNYFDSCLVFLEKYFTLKSGPFETVAGDFLTIQYYSSLIYPISSGRISKDKLPPGYFDPVDFTFFRKEELLGFREFIILLSNYNSYFYSLLSPQVNFYDSSAISARIQSASQNFEGQVKDNLLLFIFSHLSENGMGKNKAQVEQLYAFLKAAFKDEPDRMIQIEKLKRDFDTVDKLLPKEILAQQLKTESGSFVSLAEVFTSNDAVYVDFWASWCGPCISEMPYEKQLISEFKGKPIKFIFISLDKDEKQWRKAIARIDVEGTHYLISEGVKSPLIKYLSLQEIPRYIILDKTGRLINRDAPRPRAILKNKSILDFLLD